MTTNADPPDFGLFGTGSPSYTMTSYAYEKMTALAAGPGHAPLSSDPVPQLAVALPERPDPLTSVYTLHENVKFQNVAPVNGRPLTIEDVKVSVDTIISRDRGPVALSGATGRGPNRRLL